MSAWKDCPACRRRHDRRSASCGRAACISELRSRHRGRPAIPADADTYVEVGGVRYYRLVDLARRWGDNKTTVGNWFTRRARTGFPEPDLAYASSSIVGRSGGLWLAETADPWREAYEPARGGAPAGERNGAWRDGSRRRLAEDGTRRRVS